MALLVLAAACTDERGNLTDDGTGPTAVPTTLPPEPVPLPESLPVVTLPSGYSLPQVGEYFDYQLGGDYPPAEQIGIVTRDWFAGTPEPGLYNICYVNAFQTQPPDDDDRPDEREGWPAEVVLPNEDPAWEGEFVIDLSTPEHRAAAAAHVETMIATCVEKGFDAVEFDNLDTYTRFDGLPFGQAETIEYATALTAFAHDSGLAVGQKNTVELTREQARDTIGFDFAVAEDCAEFEECLAYKQLYGPLVLYIEYSHDGMVEACLQALGPNPVVYRDLGLSTPDDPEYAFETFCGGAGYG